MTIYLVWYYWYKNFWDEILLLWLISYITINFPKVEKIIIIWPDIAWLKMWIKKNNSYINYPWIISYKKSVPFFPKKQDLLFIWGWEVLTDERKPPHNWWNYLFRYFPFFLRRKVTFLWGIGSIKRKSTKFLYKILFAFVSTVIVREKFSKKIVWNFAENVILHRDFAYDIIEEVSPVIKKWGYVILNCNNHIFTQKSKDKIKTFYNKHISLWNEVYFIAWTMWNDDSDMVIYEELCQGLPNIKLFDRTSKSILQICSFFSWASWWLSARLHVILLLKFYSIPFDAFEYQEKVSRLVNT